MDKDADSQGNAGYIYELANISNRMLYATLHGDTETRAAIVNLVYLAARNDYHVIEYEGEAKR